MRREGTRERGRNEGGNKRRAKEGGKENVIGRRKRRSYYHCRQQGQQRVTIGAVRLEHTQAYGTPDALT